MADDLKRVGLVFKADGTTDFAKSLSQINDITKENYSALKLAKSQYDENTSAIKKLSDTQKYLSENTEAYKTKCRVLKEQLEELENAETRDEKAISKKRVELNNAQSALNKYESGLKEVNAKLESGQAAIEEYAKRLDDFSSKTKNTGESLTQNVTAPIVAVETAAYAAWMQLDECYDNIAKGTGAVGDALADLQNSFDNVFANVPAEAEDVATSIADINTRLGFTGEKLELASEKFLKFAEVNNTDVSNAIALVTRAMGDAGISADEYASLLDALTTASQASGLGIDSLTESLTKYGAPMRALGFDTKESIALFASWEKAGVNTEIAFSGMKKAISTFSAAGKDAKVEFAKTLEEIKKCPDIASATTKAIEVFGTKAGPDLADAIKAGRFEYEDMLALIESSTGQLEASYEATLDPADKATVAMNNLKLAGSALGSVIQNSLGPVFEGIADILKDFTEWFSNLDGTIQTTIVSIASIVAAIGPLLVIIGTLGGQVSKAISFFGKIKLTMFGAGEQAGTLATMISGITGPMIAVIAVIGLVVAAIVDLWNTNEDFRNNVTDIVNNIMSIIQNLYASVIQPIINVIIQLLKNLWNNSIKPLWEQFKQFIASIISLISSFMSILTPIINKVVSLIGTLLTPAVKAIGSVFSTIFGNIAKVIQTFLSVATSIFNNVSTLFKNLKSALTNPIESAKNTLSSIISKIKGLFSFKIKWPKIPMPHFGIRPSGWKIGDLLKGSIPKLSIDFYDKAMDKGMILDTATMFGINKNGQPMVGGETGSETIVGTNSLMNMISNAVNSNNTALIQRLEIMISLMNSFFQEALTLMEKEIVLEDGTVVGKLASEIDSELGNISRLKARGL